MSSRVRFVVPSLFLLVGLFVSAPIVSGTAPAACDQVPEAFNPGMKTETSGVGPLSSTCAVTDRETGETVAKTVINWSGMIASVAGCIGAWFLGATLSGLVDRRRGLLLAAPALLISSLALVAFFA